MVEEEQVAKAAEEEAKGAEAPPEPAPEVAETPETLQAKIAELQANLRTRDQLLSARDVKLNEAQRQLGDMSDMRTAISRLQEDNALLLDHILASEQQGFGGEMPTQRQPSKLEQLRAQRAQQDAQGQYVRQRFGEFMDMVQEAGLSLDDPRLQPAKNKPTPDEGIREARKIIAQIHKDELVEAKKTAEAAATASEKRRRVEEGELEVEPGGPSGVSGEWTPEAISRMSDEDYEKHEEAIMDAMLKGKIKKK